MDGRTVNGADGKLHQELGPLPLGTGGPDRAAVRRTIHRQMLRPSPHPPVARAASGLIEPLEHMGQVLGGDSRPRVAHLDLRQRPPHPTDAHGDRTTSSCEPEGVIEQVRHQLPEPGGVASDRDELGQLRDEATPLLLGDRVEYSATSRAIDATSTGSRVMAISPASARASSRRRVDQAVSRSRHCSPSEARVSPVLLGSPAASGGPPRPAARIAPRGLLNSWEASAVEADHLGMVGQQAGRGGPLMVPASSSSSSPPPRQWQPLPGGFPESSRRAALMLSATGRRACRKGNRPPADGEDQEDTRHHRQPDGQMRRESPPSPPARCPVPERRTATGEGAASTRYRPRHRSAGSCWASLAAPSDRQADGRSCGGGSDGDPARLADDDDEPFRIHRPMTSRTDFPLRGSEVPPGRSSQSPRPAISAALLFEDESFFASKTQRRPLCTRRTRPRASRPARGSTRG